MEITNIVLNDIGPTVLSIYSDEDYPYNNSAILWQSSNIIYLNEDCSNLFNTYSMYEWSDKVCNLSTNSLIQFNWSKVVNGASMFRDANVFGSDNVYVSNLIDASYICYNLGGKYCPIQEISDTVINMDYAFANCRLSSNYNYIIGNNVTEMSFAYENCKLKQPAVCGPKVINMIGAYANSNCTDFACSNSVINMDNAYYNTGYYGIKEDAEYKCGSNVLDMTNTYYNARLSAIPVCGPEVIYFINTYALSKVKGTPVCGDKVQYMDSAYAGCSLLTGSPNCGPNVIHMNSTYGGCGSITGSPVCGDKVKYMRGTYRSCVSLTGAPVCGPKVIDMSYAYSLCTKMAQPPVCNTQVQNMAGAYENSAVIGLAACGPNVNDMQNAYRNTSVTIPACGDQVVDMQNAYRDSSVIGPAACGSNVVDMDWAYCDCRQLTGAPACSDSVQRFDNTYSNCISLEGPPVCGNNVIDMMNVYRGCIKLKGAPACSDTVETFDSAYEGCTNIEGSPVCGAKVKFMDNAYKNCFKLSGEAACGPNVQYMNYAYQNCYNITKANCSDSVSYMKGTYSHCNLLTKAVFTKSMTSAANAYEYCNNITTTPDFDKESYYIQDMSHCFANCAELESCTIPIRSTWGSWACADGTYANCTYLKYVSNNFYYGGKDSYTNLVSINAIFYNCPQLIGNDHKIPKNIGLNCVSAYAYCGNAFLHNTITLESYVETSYRDTIVYSQFLYQSNVATLDLTNVNFNNYYYSSTNTYFAFWGSYRPYGTPCTNILLKKGSNLAKAFIANKIHFLQGLRYNMYFIQSGDSYYNSYYNLNVILVS